MILSLLKQKKIGQSQFVVLKFLLLISRSRVCMITVSVGTPSTSLEIKKKYWSFIWSTFFFFFFWLTVNCTSTGNKAKHYQLACYCSKFGREPATWSVAEALALREAEGTGLVQPQEETSGWLGISPFNAYKEWYVVGGWETMGSNGNEWFRLHSKIVFFMITTVLHWNRFPS